MALALQHGAINTAKKQMTLIVTVLPSAWIITGNADETLLARATR